MQGNSVMNILVRNPLPLTLTLRCSFRSRIIDSKTNGVNFSERVHIHQRAWFSLQNYELNKAGVCLVVAVSFPFVDVCQYTVLALFKETLRCISQGSSQLVSVVAAASLETRVWANRSSFTDIRETCCVFTEMNAVKH